MALLQPTWRESAAQVLFPLRHCPHCGTLTGDGALCPACRVQSAQYPRCTICAALGQGAGLCEYCRDLRPSYLQARAAFPYEGRLRDQLRSFKYHEQTWLRRPLAQLLYAGCREHYAKLSFDVVVPVPLFAARRKERGYNQSELLSALVAARLHLPHRPELLSRVKETPPLYPFDGAERRHLLRDVFLAQNVENLTILLIDDIYTSGATLDACSKSFMVQGAKAVYGLTVAAAGPFLQKAGILT